MPVTTSELSSSSGTKRLPVSVKIVYASEESTGLQDAYRLLARKVLEAKRKQCERQSM